MKMSISEFKAKCTQVVREVGAEYKTVDLTNRGKVVAHVVAAEPEAKPDPKIFFGSLKGTITYLEGWDAPLGEGDWEACQ
ncbi:MAG: antitoxin (DNA-binding transcriptional repressor) of toxin-antitoxin stability system [Planctomycetota bacterium]|jgi:antitoxin (DNA-binding transcriptional repressor) of toxin-antitoxin stability system